MPPLSGFRLLLCDERDGALDAFVADVSVRCRRCDHEPLHLLIRFTAEGAQDRGLGTGLLQAVLYLCSEIAFLALPVVRFVLQDRLLFFGKIFPTNVLRLMPGAFTKVLGDIRKSSNIQIQDNSLHEWHKRALWWRT